MNRQFDVKQALRVFYKIAKHGQRVNDEHRLNGMYASSDHDGYTVTIRDDAVTLRVFFHNTHKFAFRRKIDLEQFMDRIGELDRLQFGT